MSEDDLIRQEQIENANKKIAELREYINDNRVEFFARVCAMGDLQKNYAYIGDMDNCIAVCKSLIEYVRLNTDKFRLLNRTKAYRVKNRFEEAYFSVAPYSLHHFLSCMEWNYSPDMKFYANRFSVLRDWVVQLERLENGELEGLGLSAPPRSGKTGAGELFLAWLAGRHPEKSMIFATHTSRMARKAFDDINRLLTDPKRQWSRIFPGLTVSFSAEDLWIDVGPKENIYKTLYFTSIDSGKAGVMEASHLIYVDDLISGIEEAMNPTRLDNAWMKYGNDIEQRRSNGSVKELHIATRWSINDVLSRLEAENENNPRWAFIKKPGLDENGESNFNFKYNPLDKEHFEQLKRMMDEVSFECIVQQNPMEREGILFPESSLLHYEGVLPEGEPDMVCFAADIAFGGGDFLSMPIAYVYGKYAYIHDVVHHNGTKDITKPLVVAAIIRNGATGGFMEANNGGDEYAEDIGRRLSAMGYRCAITSRKAPPNRSKLDRIVSCTSEIKGTIAESEGYILVFRSRAARQGMPMYEKYMDHLTKFNQSLKYQGRQKDDAADATTSLVSNVLGKKSPEMKVYPRSLLRW